eukprot:TRINITY_DN62567_c0_g1_i1.p1 TRINITY_DN62567_c0_g1~~TRINITY_DN62567_c0_g1_i1.p1  ORF type:complete len:430 (+),score=62.32 TRINITY_DN62567_c0_g1_i1:104-1393(+)
MHDPLEEPTERPQQHQREQMEQQDLGVHTAASTADDDIDLSALLRVGTVVEAADRAARARRENNKKGQWARDAHEALSIIEAGGYEAPDGSGWIDLREPVLGAIHGSIYCGSSAWTQTKIQPPRFLSEQSIEVRCCTVLSATEELAFSATGAISVGALNFASARNPGGGFTTGASAQEESIARSSALYPCLTKHFKAFFVPSRRAASGAYTSDIIYSPGVPVIREDGGALLNRPYFVDVATAAAPNVGSMCRDSSLKEAEMQAEEALRERIPRILNLFARHGVVDIVLGAWGCGVFGNNPTTVAALFAEQLRGPYRGCFRRIIFAVLDAAMAKDFGIVFKVEVIAPSSEMSKWGAQRSWKAGRPLRDGDKKTKSKLEPPAVAGEVEGKEETKETRNEATSEGRHQDEKGGKQSRKSKRWQKRNPTDSFE